STMGASRPGVRDVSSDACPGSDGSQHDPIGASTIVRTGACSARMWCAIAVGADCRLKTARLQPRERLAQVADGLADALFVFDEGEADVALAAGTEADAWGNSDLGLLDEEGGELQGSHLCVGLG